MNSNYSPGVRGAKGSGRRRNPRAAKRRTRWFRWGLILALVGLLLAGYPFWLSRVAAWLIVDEPPQRSDVIIVLAGEPVERLATGVRLFQEGYAPRLLLSGGPLEWTVTAAAVMREEALALGVPSEAILLEDKATSTLENALYTKEILQREALTSALVVSSPYHLRRVRYVFARTYADSGIRLNYVAASPARFQVKDWWRDDYSVERVGLEYVKLVWYFLKTL